MAASAWKGRWRAGRRTAPFVACLVLGSGLMLAASATDWLPVQVGAWIVAALASLLAVLAPREEGKRAKCWLLGVSAFWLSLWLGQRQPALGFGLLFVAVAGCSAWAVPRVAGRVAGFFGLLWCLGRWLESPASGVWVPISESVLLLGAALIGGWAARRYDARAKSEVERLAQEHQRRTERQAHCLRLGRSALDIPNARTLDEVSLIELRSGLRDALSLCREVLSACEVSAWCLDREGSAVLCLQRSQEGTAPEELSANGVWVAACRSSDIVEWTGARAQRALEAEPHLMERGTHVAVLAVRDEETVSFLLRIVRATQEGLSSKQAEALRHCAQWTLRHLHIERLLLDVAASGSQQSKLYRAVERLNTACTESEVLQAAVESAAEFAAFHFAAVTLCLPQGRHEICAVRSEEHASLLGQQFQTPDGLVAMACASRQALPYRGECDPALSIVFSRELATPDLSSLLVVPLLVHNRALGSLVLGAQQPGAFSEQARMSLEVLARHIAVSLSNARMMQRLEALATTDGLTRLLNKRALLEAASEKLRSAQRFGTPLSVIVCDLDHFKSVNDTHGHDVGDLVIQRFADVLRSAKRETDVVGRFGGEEFVVLAEQTDERGALQLAERIRQEMEVTRVIVGQQALQVTCSIGIATHPHGGGSWEELFRATDQALYESKRNGRNQATIYSARPGRTSHNPVPRAG